MIFDPRKIIDIATFEKPAQYPLGITISLLMAKSLCIRVNLKYCSRERYYDIRNQGLETFGFASDLLFLGSSESFLDFVS